MTLKEMIEQFIIDHAMFFLAIAIVLLFALFITICVAVCGVSATESGALYNGFDKVI